MALTLSRASLFCLFLGIVLFCIFTISSYVQIHLLCELIISNCLGINYYVNLDFTKTEYSAPRTIENIKIVEAILEQPAKQHCQFGPFTKKSGKMG